MMRIFIVDDETLARDRLRMLLQDIAEQCPHQVVGDADNPQAALDGIIDATPDLVLLDVQMPGMTGIELAAHIAKLPHPPAIVFVTAHDQYALKAFDLDAVDYLLKPVRATRLAETLQRVEKLRSQKRVALPKLARRQHFSVMERGRMLLVPVREVIFLKAELKYVTVRTHERDYLIEDPLIAIEEEMADVFVRVHRNALVARAAIMGFERGSMQESGSTEKGGESWEVILRGTTERLPISRRQWPTIRALIK
ncbi:MAG: DNA-binding response regulator [Oxalobacter sp.]|nr:MAG: DNA-binding response regulator [Oxalobacter sp.]